MSPLTNDRGQMKNPFAKVSISFDRNLRPGGITIDALCKSTPSQLLRYRDTQANSLADWPRKFIVSILWTETIARRIRRKSPTGALFRRAHQHLDKRAAVPARNNQGRVIEIRRHDSGPISGESDLLLMMPAFRQFASSIKPV